jgi:ethanolamine ammonia-lyase large subunit
MAKATPERSGDQLAGITAEGPVERLAAQMALADLSLKAFLSEELISSCISPPSDKADHCARTGGAGHGFT